MSSVQFQKFAKVVADSIQRLSFDSVTRRILMGRAELWENYLSAFPEGTNPIYRTNTEHDGSYDRGFIRRYGSLIFFTESGNLATVWDDAASETLRDQLGFYVDVAAVMKAKVMDAFKREGNTAFAVNAGERFWGHAPNVEDSTGITYHHLYATPAETLVLPVGTVSTAFTGEVNGIALSAAKSLKEIGLSHAIKVMELIEANSLQRGAEYKSALREFIKAKEYYEGTADGDKGLFHHFYAAGYVSPRSDIRKAYRTMAIRGTALGTLLQELSEGKPMEQALRSYNTMTDASNYRRSTVTASLSGVARAQATVDELGLTDALARRHATIADVSINDVLWADNAAKSHMRGSLLGMLKSAPLAPLSEGVSESATQVTLDEFIQNIMPKAKELSILISKEVTGNFMNVTTAAIESAPKLFKWDNPFAWSYRGDVADSITDRVSNYGGKVDGKMRFSLAWNNSDDLDLHCDSPMGRINFRNRMGILDLDMNGMDKHSSTDPVENMVWNSTPADGTYVFSVNQYARRSNQNGGFEAEFRLGEHSIYFTCPRHLQTGETVPVLSIVVKNGVVENKSQVSNHVTASANPKPQSVWGLTVGQRVRVTSVMTSPNYWAGAATGEAGNKHFFFTLEGAENPDSVRGFYPEQLRSELHDHRRVFEMLGKEIAVPFSDTQLAGLGFSTTLRRSFVIYADNRPYKVNV